MKIFYIHHALRDFKNDGLQKDGLMPLGIEDAKNVGKIFKGVKEKLNLTTIYTSTFFRCIETARLINEYLNINVVEDERFNEFKSISKSKPETWSDCQRRIKEALKDIVYSHSDDETVLCVTSGVNLTAFICVAYGLECLDNHPFPMVYNCSPVGFEISHKNFDTDRM